MYGCALRMAGFDQLISPSEGTWSTLYIDISCSTDASSEFTNPGHAQSFPRVIGYIVTNAISR